MRKTMRPVVGVLIGVLAIGVSSCGDDALTTRSAASGEDAGHGGPEGAFSEQPSPDGFYAAITVMQQGDRAAERATASQVAQEARDLGYADARVAYDNGGPADCVRGPIAADGSFSEACGTPSPGFLVILEGPYADQQPPGGSWTAEEHEAFAGWHSQMAAEVRKRASRRGLEHDVMLGYFYVAAGEDAP